MIMETKIYFNHNFGLEVPSLPCYFCTLSSYNGTAVLQTYLLFSVSKPTWSEVAIAIVLLKKL